MAGAEPIYYWDSCLFIAWLKDEQRPTGEMDGVREIIQRSQRKEVKIVTSVLTKVEVLSGHIPVGLNTLFSGVMKRIHPISMDIKVADLAHDLRDHYSNNRSQHGGKILSTPDAIHLATAILYRVTEFHTFDRDGDAKHLGLLPLSGDVGGHRLTIMQTTGKKSATGPSSGSRHNQTGSKPADRTNRANRTDRPHDPEQYKRFLEAARAAEADETTKGADKAFKAVVKPRKSTK